MRLGCALLVLALAATAASFSKPRPQLRVTDGGRMTFQRAAVPRSKGAAIGTDNFAFLTARHGFAATTGGAGEEPKVGYRQPTDAGRIEETRDGGATWKTVWQRRHMVFSAIAFANGRVGVAGGAITTGPNDGLPTMVPQLVATQDGGRSWHVLPRPPFPAAFFFQGMYDPKPIGQLQLPSPEVWYAFMTKLDWPATRAELWRSADAGRHWRRIRMPDGTTIAAFPTPLVGYAGAWARGCRTPEQLWKTLDGGRTWRPVPGTCGDEYSSLDFLDAEHGFTAESTSPEDSFRRVVIRATDDGGHRWRVLQRDAGWQATTRLFFSDLRRGWATSDEWDQGFEYTSVHVTSDGGLSWRTVPYPGLPEGVFGSWAWVGPWRTADWGRTWRVSDRPELVFPRMLLIASGRRLDVDTSDGRIESTDGARTWRTRPSLSALEIAKATGARAYVQPSSDYELHLPVAYLRTGRGWRPLVPDRYFSAGAVAFTDERHGLLVAADDAGDPPYLPVYRTADGGRSWQRVPVPRGVAGGATALVAPGTILIPNASDPPGRTVVFLSTDSGRHWQRMTVAGTTLTCSLSRPTRASIWILCAPFMKPQTTLLRSDDGGAHWLRLTGRSALDPAQMVTTGPRSAWTVGVGPDRPAQTGPPLWHTTDGGRTWNAVWPTIGPSNRVYGLRPS